MTRNWDSYEKNYIHNLWGIFYILGIWAGLISWPAFMYDKFFVRFELPLKIVFFGAVPLVVVIFLFLRWFKVDSKKVFYWAYHVTSFISIFWIMNLILRDQCDQGSIGILRSKHALHFFGNMYVFLVILFGTPIGIFTGVVVYTVSLIRWRGREFLKDPLDTFANYLGTSILRFVLYILWIVSWLYSCHFLVAFWGLGGLMD